MNFFQGNKKFILIGIIVLLLGAIPLTVSYLQQQQISNSHAQAATTIYFATPGQTTATDTIQKAVGEDIPLDIVLNPGTNVVSFVKLNISYDATKLDATADSFKPNPDVFPSNGILEGPTVANGSITVTLSIGIDATRQITTPSKIATITFKAKDTTGSTPTQVKFMDGQTQVLSVATNEHNEANVLASTKPITIAIGAATNSPTATPTAGPTGPTQIPVANQAPTCTTLNIDRTPSGKAPLSLTFTANGRDADGTISKVTFNFGDGPVQDITQTGGIGTNTVSATASHTYNNPGTFQASAILTDNTGAISSGTTCTQTITVTATTPGGGIGGIPGGGVTGGATGSGVPTVAPIQQPIPTTPIAVAPTARVVTPRPTLPAAGPGDTLIKGGVIAAIVSIAGALMFFAL